MFRFQSFGRNDTSVGGTQKRNLGRLFVPLGTKLSAVFVSMAELYICWPNKQL